MLILMKLSEIIIFIDFDESSGSLSTFFMSFVFFLMMMMIFSLLSLFC